MFVGVKESIINKETLLPAPPHSNSLFLFEKKHDLVYGSASSQKNEVCISFDLKIERGNLILCPQSSQFILLSNFLGHSDF